MPAKKEVKKSTKQYRTPVVTIMGHVDHGKTSILDAIRNTTIVRTESGGITQHINAYTIEKNKRKITFIDTPGHEAFSKMRSRGGAVADIIVLVVAANDGVMPQTKEAIMHAKASSANIIVAINKCDLPGADPEKVRRQLSENGIAVEGYGGDIVTVEVSATKGTNIDQLVDVILLVVDMNQEKFELDESGKFEAVVIESKKHPKRGVLVTVLVKSGILKKGQDLFSKTISGKVKQLTDWNGKLVDVINAGEAAEIMGFSDVLEVGDVLRGEKGEVVIKPDEVTTSGAEVVLETDSNTLSKKLNVIIRADSTGTQEAIENSISKISVDGSVVNILFSATGPVKESDVLLASTSRAIIIAFKSLVSDSIKELAKSSKVLIREHDIIYKLLEEIEEALEGVLEIEEAKIKGKGIVIEKFTLPKSGDLIVGMLIESGKFKANNRIGIFRNDSDVPVFVTKIRSIHIGKLEVDSASKGDECGLMFKPSYDDVQLEDVIKIL